MGAGEIVAGSRPELAFRTSSSEFEQGHQVVEIPLIRSDLELTATTQIVRPNGEVIDPLGTDEQRFEAVRSTGADLSYTLRSSEETPTFLTALRAYDGWRYSRTSEVATAPLEGNEANGYRPQHVFEIPLSAVNFSGLASSIMSTGDRAIYAHTEDLNPDGSDAHIGVAMYGVDISTDGISISAVEPDDAGELHVAKITAEDSSKRSGVDLYLELNEAEDTLRIIIQSASEQLISKIASRVARVYAGGVGSITGNRLGDYTQPLKDALPGRIKYVPFQDRVVSSREAEIKRRLMDGYRPDQGIEWPKLPEIPWGTLGKIGGVVAVIALLSMLRSCDFDFDFSGPEPKAQAPDLLSCAATDFEVPGDFSSQVANMTPDEFTESLRRQGLSAADADELQQLAGVVLSLDGESETTSQLNALNALGVIADHAQNIDSGSLLEEKTGVLVTAVCHINGLPLHKSFTVEASGPWLLSSLHDLDTEGVLSEQQKVAIVRLLMAVRNPVEMDPDTNGNPTISDWQGITTENSHIQVGQNGRVAIFPN